MQMAESIVQNNALASSQEKDAEPIELEVQLVKASPIVRAALEFFALRCGQSVEEYCIRAILCSLRGDEESSCFAFDPDMELKEAA
jgi:hypothetical protein